MSQTGLGILLRALEIPKALEVPNTTAVFSHESIRTISASPLIGGKLHLGVEDISRICHEACRSVCAADGDTERPTWEAAPDWQKDSIRKGVAYIQKNPDAPAGALHDAWMKDKVSQGWTHGKVKDEEAKTHPCLVPYNKLPLIERVKDHLIGSLVRALS